MRCNSPNHWRCALTLALLLPLTVVGTGCDSKEPPAEQLAADVPRERTLAPQTKRVPLLNLDLKAAPEPEPVDVTALLREKQCHLCHDASRQKLGPPYEAVSLAHRQRRDLMLEVLAQKIISGGSGNWGVIPMVANRHVSIEEARLMAGWILDPE